MVGRATLCWCTAEFHIPPLWSLAASLGVMWSTCLPPTDPLSSPGPCRTGNFHLRIARLQRSLCSRATPKAWPVLVRPVHRLWRWRVTPNPYLARPACYLRCSGMNRRCRCRKTVVGVSFYFLLLLHRPSFQPHFHLSSYIPRRFTNPDLMILRHVLYLGLISPVTDRNKPFPIGMRPLHGIRPVRCLIHGLHAHIS
jgi:hypothetical protein